MISAWERLHFATLELVRSTPIKQRLVCAYRRHLAALQESEIPIEVRESYGQVIRSLCGVAPLRGEEAVTASVRKMSNQEADDCAAQIVEIFGMMCKTHHSATRSGSVVQLHAVERAEDEFPAAALLASN
ncbi:MAG TPA: hypothetical protein VNH39_00565 [Steroidobacteraceae bacterium]|nr:hypothetical protein [Steroidobacteraceae bacterium]